MKKKTTLLLLMAASTIFVSELRAQQRTIVETAVAAGNFDTLVTAVKAAGLVDTLNGNKEFTVFAPTDAAFENVDPATLQSLLQPENKSQLTSVLTYHVLPGKVAARDAYNLSDVATVNGQRLSLDFKGDALRVGNAVITKTDIECSNGVIHVIDAVLLPEFETILATAYQADNFSTLLAAVGIAGLNDVLNGDGPFTVFAPTDEAFAKLPEGTVESLLQPENREQLINVLKYHVVPGRLHDDEAVAAGRANTLLGPSIEVSLSADGVRINQSKVLAKNLPASNGLVHVIDQVLLPSKMSRRQVLTSLNAAIERGVPVFNSGHHGQCCDIYMNAMTEISDSGIDNMDDHSMMLVKQTIKKAQGTRNMAQRAWVLREGMDQLYRQASRMSDNIGR
ncbi:MAG: fasciclin domain-containing protein [Mariniblastus sp.]|nr:fasciclin domain-containing protein [Mariniblastus sp.]